MSCNEINQGEANQRVSRLYKQCVVSRKLDPYQAAEQIHEAIGGITRIDYDPNKCFRIYNHHFNMRFTHQGMKKKQVAALEELAVILHHFAVESRVGFDQTQISSVRLTPRNGSAISTKHYANAYRQHQQSVLSKYAADKAA